MNPEPTMAPASLMPRPNVPPPGLRRSKAVPTRSMGSGFSHTVAFLVSPQQAGTLQCGVPKKEYPAAVRSIPFVLTSRAFVFWSHSTIPSGAWTSCKAVVRSFGGVVKGSQKARTMSSFPVGGSQLQSSLFSPSPTMMGTMSLLIA